MGRLIQNILSKDNRGQLLIEALVAISVMMVGMMAVFGVISQSLSLNRVAADQYIAANLASEGIEIVKNMVDSEYPDYGFGTSIGSHSPSLCALDIDTEPAYMDVDWNCAGSLDYVPALKLNKDTGVYSLSEGSPTKFKRYVEISQIDPNYIEINSTVDWGIKGGTVSHITVVDTLYNWRRF